jgi:cytochrome c oxidase assembly protein subunit 15
MQARLQRLSERTNGYTVTPEQYVRYAYVALGALTLIVLTGAAVRLTGSGLGCPTWPKCYGNVYPPLNSHAVIEFSNRMITFPVCLAAGMAWLAAVRRRPYRRDLVWNGALLPLGVVAQAVLGGFTVKGALDYGWVMSHFALSMLILVAAVVLVWRASHEPSEGPKQAAEESASVVDRALVLWMRALVGLGALTIVAGTAATAAGPHAGGSPGQKINRLDFDGTGTMDFVIHRHAEIAFVFSLACVGVWWLARRRNVSATIQRPLTALCVLLALQGVVGLDQYYTHLPTELVWVHVGLASCAWISLLWSALATGALLPSRARTGAVRASEGHLRAPAPLEFPGN